jgi:hypothetical protein
MHFVTSVFIHSSKAPRSSWPPTAHYLIKVTKHYFAALNVGILLRAAPIFFLYVEKKKQLCHGLVRLVGCQPAVLFSHTSISHQPPANQQYFSLTTNQPQLPATSQPNGSHVLHHDDALKMSELTLKRPC